MVAHTERDSLCQNTQARWGKGKDHKQYLGNFNVTFKTLSPFATILPPTPKNNLFKPCLFIPNVPKVLTTNHNPALTFMSLSLGPGPGSWSHYSQHQPLQPLSDLSPIIPSYISLSAHHSNILSII